MVHFSFFLWGLEGRGERFRRQGPQLLGSTSWHHAIQQQNQHSQLASSTEKETDAYAGGAECNDKQREKRQTKRSRREKEKKELVTRRYCAPECLTQPQRYAVSTHDSRATFTDRHRQNCCIHPHERERKTREEDKAEGTEEKKTRKGKTTAIAIPSQAQLCCTAHHPV